MQYTIGLSLVLLSALCVGFGSVLAKLIMCRLDSVVLGWFRALFGLLFSLVLFLGVGEWQIVYRLTLPHVAIMLSDAFFYFMASLFYLKAVQLGNLSVISPLTQSHPLFVLILAVVFLHEQLTLVLILGSIMTVGGIMILSSAAQDRVSLDGVSNSLQVIAPALGCAISTAIFIVITKYIIQFVSPLTLNLAQMLIALIGFSILTTKGSHVIQIDARMLGLIAAMSLITYVVGNIAYYHALRRISSVVASPFLTTSIIFGTLFGVIFFREPLKARHLSGIALALIGVVIISINLTG